MFPNGKTRLIPVAILADGQYYDASLYQASPVPMALYSGTVYEGFRNGVSQGLFTVKDALSSPNNVWQGEGKWETTTELEKKKAQKPSSPIPRDLDEADAPPKLRHGGGSDKSPQSHGATAPPAPSAAPAPSVPATPKADDSKPATATTATATATPTPASPEKGVPDSGPVDANAPQLKRGKSAVPESADDVVRIPHKGEKAVPASVPTTSKAAAKTSMPATEQPKATDIFPAISDAHSVESHSYDYPMKAGEEDTLRRKMLALADIDVHARDKELSQVQSSPRPASPAKRKPAQLLTRSGFTDIHLRVVDVSSSNEPTLVLSATATSPVSGRQYMLTVVAHEDVYGDLHKAFGSITDADHLDILPRMELIDAVDVDGDGRGDLLFRQVYDSGTAYVVYRVSGDQLYPLFQGAKS